MGDRITELYGTGSRQAALDDAARLERANGAGSDEHPEGHVKDPAGAWSPAALRGRLAGLSRRQAAIRAAATEAEDDRARPLADALDATLRQATDLVSALGATTTLTPEVAQALALIIAADTLSGDLLEMLGVPDPGDATLPAPSRPGVRASARSAAEARAAARKYDRSGPGPGNQARLEPFRATWRHQPVKLNGKTFSQLDGYATVYDLEYEMWDMFGPYTEHVAAGAADKTLAASPDVAFLTNHKGLTMARTRAQPGSDPTLILDSDPRGMHSLAYVNPERNDVHDLLLAIDDGNVTEMSFAFMITDGGWDEDFEHFTITEFDLDRGDVSAVNFGANPYTSIGARSREIMGELEHLPAGAQRAAFSRLAVLLGGPESVVQITRAAGAAVDQAPKGKSLGFYEAMVDLDV